MKKNTVIPAHTSAAPVVSGEQLQFSELHQLNEYGHITCSRFEEERLLINSNKHLAVI